jgi:hypothetical protein
MPMGGADTATELANLALEALGETKRVGDVTTDTSSVGKALQMQFWPVFDETLEGYPWNCARKRARIAAHATITPAFDFTSYYPLPADFIGLQEIHGLVEGDRWAVEAAGAEGAEFMAIACDLPAPLDLVYTYRLRNLALASPSLKGAFVHGLAFKVAMPVTGDSKKRDAQFTIWKDAMAIGQRNDGRLQSNRRPPEPEILRVRE